VRALADSESTPMDSVQLCEKLERLVRERTAQLEEANRALDAFAHAVAHEIKTPLSHILGFAELVADSPALPECLKGHVSHIELGARRLDRLVVAMLNAAHSGRGEVRRAPLDLGEVARDVVLDLGLRPQIRVEIAPDLVTMADHALVRVILRNLIGNAAKYSRDVLHPRIEIGSDGPGVFFVRDNGCGFDDQDPRLFHAFSRLSAPGNVEGTGIGLSTTRQLVQKHGGKLWAESRPGQGATFRFTLAGL